MAGNLAICTDRGNHTMAGNQTIYIKREKQTMVGIRTIYTEKGKSNRQYAPRGGIIHWR